MHASTMTQEDQAIWLRLTRTNMYLYCVFETEAERQCANDARLMLDIERAKAALKKNVRAAQLTGRFFLRA